MKPEVLTIPIAQCIAIPVLETGCVHNLGAFCLYAAAIYFEHMQIIHVALDWTLTKWKQLRANSYWSGGSFSPTLGGSSFYWFSSRSSV